MLVMHIIIFYAKVMDIHLYFRTAARSFSSSFGSDFTIFRSRGSTAAMSPGGPLPSVLRNLKEISTP